MYELNIYPGNMGLKKVQNALEAYDLGPSGIAFELRMEDPWTKMLSL